VEQETDTMIDLQKEITAVPAIGPDNDGEGEVKRAELLKTILERIGFDAVEEYRCPDKRVPEGYRPNIVGKVFGKNRDRNVWILSHMDIVPPGELDQWDSDPYTVVVRDGKLYGRGVEDNQQAMVASIAVGKVLLEEKIVPPFNLALALVSDEETGSKHGLEYLIQQNVFENGDLIVVPDFGSPDGDKIEIAEKSIVWFKFTVRGVQCHASKPLPRSNSLRTASDLVVNLERLYESFATKDELFEPPISTFEPTKKEPNVPNVNTIPGEDVFFVDCRVLPRFSIDEILQEVQKIAREVEQRRNLNISVEIAKRDEASDPTPQDADVVRALAKSIKAVHGKTARLVGVGGGTVAAVFRRYGMPAAVWTQNEETAHQVNESCTIQNMVGDAKVFAALAMDPTP
jgi:succinyl-diaminopimelate desuccinylase